MAGRATGLSDRYCWTKEKQARHWSNSGRNRYLWRERFGRRAWVCSWWGITTNSTQVPYCDDRKPHFSWKNQLYTSLSL